MKIPKERKPVKEYSMDDESIKNIVNEITDDEGLQSYLLKITELIESLESKKVNYIINYLLYGMILFEGSDIQCLASVHSERERLLQEYYSGLDKVEEALSSSSKIEADKFPELVDNLRMDKDFYKKNKKELDSLIAMLPDICKNLEMLSCLILGIK